MSRAAARAADAEIIEKLLAGEEAAYASLVDRLHGRLVRLARLFVASDAVAEEVAQETWVSVIEGLPGFKRQSALDTWIFTIVSNRARTRAKREARSVPVGAMDDLDPGPPEPSVDPARFGPGGMWSRPPADWEQRTPVAHALEAEALERIREEVQKLPAGPRAVVTLRDIEGLSAEETCNILEISETNQRVLLHRGRSRLRALLEEYFGPD